MFDTAPIPVPADRFTSGDFIEACRQAPTSLIYFLLNVGDGDTQLILLPGDPLVPGDTRRGIVVDVATNNKLPELIEALANDIFPERQDGRELALVVGTHPHDDHIGGMPQFLERFGTRVAEYWDSGYYHPNSSYLETMVHLENHRQSVQLTQPTSGMVRYIGMVRIVAVTPGVGLRGRFDTYGVNINDASIAIRLEFPASRIVQQTEDHRTYKRPEAPWSLLLGADAQTTSWAQAAVDFPQLLAVKEARALLKDQIGSDALEAEIFKVPHHASKHGVNVELVERVNPTLSLVSSVGGAGRYNFPHHLAIESMREGMEPTTSGQERSLDFDLPIVYTSDSREAPSGTPLPLGSIAVIVPSKRGQKLRLWRFGDGPRDPVDLTQALEFKVP